MDIENRISWLLIFVCLAVILVSQHYPLPEWSIVLAIIVLIVINLRNIWSLVVEYIQDADRGTLNLTNLLSVALGVIAIALAIGLLPS